MKGLDKGDGHPPAAMHPSDLEALGIAPDSLVTIGSRHATMLARVEADDSLRVGLVAVVHGFGASSSGDGKRNAVASGSVTRLVNMDEYDPISGIPRMSALPVTVQAVPTGAAMA